MSAIHELLNVPDEVYIPLVDIVPPILAQCFIEDTPVAIKATTIARVIKLISNIGDEHTPHTYALIGMMVEQAYNAAVLQSKKPPLFKILGKK